VIRIPLSYSKRVFGYGLVDDSQEHLLAIEYFSVTLPRNLRAMAKKRPDIIQAFLTEDVETRARCSPFVNVVGMQVLLAHMVLRGQLAKLVLERNRLSTVFSTGSPQSQSHSDINEIRSSIGRLAYVNGDKTDCQSQNLREL